MTALPPAQARALRRKGHASQRKRAGSHKRGRARAGKGALRLGQAGPERRLQGIIRKLFQRLPEAPSGTFQKGPAVSRKKLAQLFTVLTGGAGVRTCAPLPSPAPTSPKLCGPLRERG